MMNARWLANPVPSLAMASIAVATLVLETTVLPNKRHSRFLPITQAKWANTVKGVQPELECMVFDMNSSAGSSV